MIIFDLKIDIHVLFQLHLCTSLQQIWGYPEKLVFYYNFLICVLSLRFLKEVKSNHISFVPRTLQGNHREPSVETLRSPISERSGGTQRRIFALEPERINENINVNKYFISSSGDRTHNQSILQSHYVPLCHVVEVIRLSIISNWGCLPLSIDMSGTTSSYATLILYYIGCISS